MSDHIKEAIIEYWGERCNGYSEGCPVCEAWKELDALEAENAKLRRQVEFVKRRHHDNDGEGWCGVCGYRGQDQQYGHESDCPHAEAT